MDEIFKALGDPIRLQIIRMLAERGELCVCRIVDELQMNQPAISHHMAKLKQTGLVHHHKRGQWIYYSLNIEGIKAGPYAFLTEILTLAENSKPNIGDISCCREI